MLCTLAGGSRFYLNGVWLTHFGLSDHEVAHFLPIRLTNPLCLDAVPIMPTSTIPKLLNHLSRILTVFLWWHMHIYIYLSTCVLLQIELPDSYQECLQMVGEGERQVINAVGQMFHLPRGYHLWQRQALRRLLRNRYRDWGRSFGNGQQ